MAITFGAQLDCHTKEWNRPDILLVVSTFGGDAPILYPVSSQEVFDLQNSYVDKSKVVAGSGSLLYCACYTCIVIPSRSPKTYGKIFESGVHSGHVSFDILVASVASDNML